MTFSDGLLRMETLVWADKLRRTFIQPGYRLENLPRAMTDRESEREQERERERERERESSKFMLSTRFDDDDDDDVIFKVK